MARSAPVPALTIMPGDCERPVSLPVMLTTDQVAAKLQQTQETIREWARQGKLPAVKFGKALLFVEHEVLAALEANRLVAK
jgi:excisionase family DNA binding protein